MTVTVNYIFKVRGRPAANWVTDNEVLMDRVLGLETDTDKFKFGDGVTAWNSLPYASGLMPADIGVSVQAYDADLTAIAALTSAANKLPYATGSGTWAMTDFSAFGRSLVDDADAAAARTTLQLVIGTNVQAYDADLAAIAALTSAADRVPYSTGSGTWSLATFSAFGRSFVDDADAAAGRTTLGLGTIATQSAGAVAITGGAALLSGLTYQVTANKRFLGREVTASAIADYSTGGAAITFSRANDGVNDLAAIFSYITAGGAANIAIAARGDAIIGAGGGGTYANCTERLRVVGSSGHVLPGADNTQNLGSGSLRFATVYAGTGTINTSDQRLKKDISGVPDAWLDAWGDVKWRRFKFTDGTRWHIGLVAQEVRDAFLARGIDATAIGLLCYDEFARQEATPAVTDDKGAVVRPAHAEVPAGNRWGLRYDECEAMEAAWQRRELARLRSGLLTLGIRL